MNDKEEIFERLENLKNTLVKVIPQIKEDSERALMLMRLNIDDLTKEEVEKICSLNDELSKLIEELDKYI